jgi:hypothetical protein
MIAPPPKNIRVRCPLAAKPVIRVSWGAPEGLTEGLLRYVVEVKERGSPRPFQVGVLGRYHHAEITTVKPFTVYEVRVRADTNATTGMFSKWHRVFVNATSLDIYDLVTSVYTV